MLTKEQILRIIEESIAEHEKPNSGSSRSTKVAHTIAAEKIASLLEEDQSILVTAAALENEVTSNLMDMLAGTILATLILQDGGGRTNISFSPSSMKLAMDQFKFTSEIDGMVRTVRIAPKNPEEWDAASGAEAMNATLRTMGIDATVSYDTGEHSVIYDPDESTEGAKPQAEHKEHDRPVWAVRYMAEQDEGERAVALLPCVSREQAEQRVRVADAALLATTENRCCFHLECPSTKCLRPEVTSG